MTEALGRPGFIRSWPFHLSSNAIWPLGLSFGDDTRDLLEKVFGPLLATLPSYSEPLMVDHPRFGQVRVVTVV